MPQSNGQARHIVLLSDGTGNSSAKLMKTNVWRLYEALDLTSDHQLALYDNGVGTSSFKPFAVLGGALGFGLKRNVLDLYVFACRNFRGATPEQAADRLFAFGFSRGAFTTRVLVGLIGQEGLITGAHGRELERRARWAYRNYRRHFNPTGGLVTALRWLRDRWLRWWERPNPPYDNTSNARPEIAFVGLWDTVDAYGLPIDEMTRGWDRWVWPLSMRERNMPPTVTKVCHALALDDERHTFHPLLLDESRQPLADNTDDEAVSQVWFAGVHSNVGGGYPDDSLSHVSLRWMAAAADKQGLRLLPVVTALWDAHVNPHGPIYDSRRGLGSYYRYNPRLISKLTDDAKAGVSVPRPKIHESVFRRIEAARDDYAPIVLPVRYAVTDDRGQIVEPSRYEAEQAAARGVHQEHLWNLVWWRRGTYFSTVLLTSALVLPPLFATAGDLPWLQNEALAQLDPQWRAASAVIEAVGSVLPDMAQTWVNFYRNHPVPLVVGAVLLAVLLTTSWQLQRRLGDQMRLVWDQGRPGAPALAAPVPPTDFVYRLRTSPRYLATVRLFSYTIFPFVFGFGTLLAIVLTLAGTVNRGAFALLGATGAVCTGSGGAAAAVSTRATRLLYPKNLCQQTGLRVERGATYRVRVVDLPAGGWLDKTIPIPTASGVGSAASPFPYLPALPFRRVLMAQWMQPIARIGDKAAEYHPLGADLTFTAGRSGDLFLFVNDAIGVGPWWDVFYGNNDDRPATVTIEKITPVSRR